MSRILLSTLAILLSTGHASGLTRNDLAAVDQALELRLDCRYDDAFRALASAYRRASSEEARLYLLRTMESLHPDLETPDLWTSFLETVAPSSSLARIYLSAERLRQGRVDDCLALRRSTGVITQWLAVGPFDNEDGSGHDTVYPPERPPPDLRSSHQGKLRTVTWRTLSANPWGRVKPDNWFRPWQEATAYFSVFLRADEARQVRILLGINTPFKLLLNGGVVADSPALHPFAPDQHAFLVSLRPGWNLLTLKSSQPDQDEWKFLCRIESDPPIEQSLVPPAAGIPPPPEALATAYDPVQASLESLLPESEFHLVHWSFLLKNTDTARNDPGRRFERLAKNRPSHRNLLYAAITQPSRRGTAGLLRQALRMGDRDEILVHLVQHAATLERDPERYDLLRRIRRMPRRLRSFLVAEHLRKSRYHEAGRLLEPWPFAKDAEWHLLAGIRTVLQPACGDPEDLFRTAFLLDRTSEAARERLVETLLRRGKTADALAVISQAIEVFPDSVELLADRSDLLLRLGRTMEAAEDLARGRRICPEDPYVLKRSADLAETVGDSVTAERFRRLALDLRPGDADLRLRIQTFHPSTNRLLDLDPEPDLSSFRGRGNTRVLLRRELCELHPDGTSTRLVRRLVFVGDDGEDPRRWTTEHLFYDPAIERVDILRARVYDDLSGLSYRESQLVSDRPYGGHDPTLFYDLRVRTVSFPGVRPGSVIEWRYLVTEQDRNPAKVGRFGRAFRIAETLPVDRAEIHLLHPEHLPLRTVFEHLPDGVRPSTNRRTVRDLRSLSFTFSNLPPRTPEPLSPPETQLGGTLVASTFRDWPAFGAWLTDLYRNRLLPDETVATTARRITRGLTDPTEQAKAVARFVASTIRYTGLELGLGGIQPRKASETLASGFGDCKDKAALMAAMLRELGIPASIALVRTTERGTSSFPLPLIGAFDHAACYAVGRLWDPTVQLLDPTVVPWQNMANPAFLLDGNNSRFLPLPVPKPEDNRLILRTHIALEPDGTAVLERAEIRTGQEAAYLRHELLSPERRILERWTATFPGTVLEASVVSNLHPPKDPAIALFRLRIPSFAKRESGRSWIPAFPLPAGFLDLYAPQGGERATETVIPYPIVFEETAEIRLPQGWQPVDLPGPVVERHPFGTLESRTEIRNRTVVLLFRLVLSADRIRPQDFPAFRRWLLLADRTRERPILLRTEP